MIFGNSKTAEVMQMKKHTLYRVIFYVIGLIAGVNFGNTTFALYAVFVAVEILLHTVQSRRGRLNAKLSLQIG